MALEQSDGYKLIRQIGVGIAGPVWMADGPAGRVAMHRFASSSAQGGEEWQADRAHFLHAGRQALGFKHPRVVPVHDVIDDSDDAWIASEFVEDETLDTILKHERLSIPQANQILRTLAQVLDKAHASGIVHGDLKPSNIFIGKKKSVRVADLAISPRARRSPRTDMPPGWVHPYITPEHLISPGTIGPRSDVYSLAAIAWYMYTGRPPFSSDTDMRAAILRGQLDAPAAVSRVLSGGLETPLRKAMSRDPGQRFADCGGVVSALEAGRDADAVPEETEGKAGSSQRLIYAGIGSLVLAMAVAAALLFHAPRKAEPKTASVSALPIGASGTEIAAIPPATHITAKPAKKTAAAKAATPQEVSIVAPKPGPFRQQPVASPPPQTVQTTGFPVPPRTIQPSQIPNSGPPAGTFIPPADAPKGYSLAVYSRQVDNAKHFIEKGISFKYLDPELGEMGIGDLKAKIILNGPPPGKGHRLSIEWDIDGKIADGRLVNPNTVSDFGSEPVRGSYRVVLRLDNDQVADYTFRIAP